VCQVTSTLSRPLLFVLIICFFLSLSLYVFFFLSLSLSISGVWGFFAWFGNHMCEQSRCCLATQARILYVGLIRCTLYRMFSLSFKLLKLINIVNKKQFQKVAFVNVCLLITIIWLLIRLILLQTLIRCMLSQECSMFQKPENSQTRPNRSVHPWKWYLSLFTSL